MKLIKIIKGPADDVEEKTNQALRHLQEFGNKIIDIKIAESKYSITVMIIYK